MPEPIKYLNTVTGVSHLFGFHGELGPHTVCHRILHRSRVESITLTPAYPANLCRHCLKISAAEQAQRSATVAVQAEVERLPDHGESLWETYFSRSCKLERILARHTAQWCNAFSSRMDGEIPMPMPQGTWRGNIGLDEVELRQFGVEVAYGYP